MDYGGIKEMHFNSADLWIPDIQIYNNADEANINHYGMTHCLVQSNGDVIWVCVIQGLSGQIVFFELLILDTLQMITLDFFGVKSS